MRILTSDPRAFSQFCFLINDKTAWFVQCAFVYVVQAENPK